MVRTAFDDLHLQFGNHPDLHNLIHFMSSIRKHFEIFGTTEGTEIFLLLKTSCNSPINLFINVINDLAAAIRTCGERWLNAASTYSERIAQEKRALMPVEHNPAETPAIGTGNYSVVSGERGSSIGGGSGSSMGKAGPSHESLPWHDQVDASDEVVKEEEEFSDFAKSNLNELIGKAEIELEIETLAELPHTVLQLVSNLFFDLLQDLENAKSELLLAWNRMSLRKVRRRLAKEYYLVCNDDDLRKIVDEMQECSDTDSETEPESEPEPEPKVDPRDPKGKRPLGKNTWLVKGLKKTKNEIAESEEPKQEDPKLEGSKAEDLQPEVPNIEEDDSTPGESTPAEPIKAEDPKINNKH